MQATSLDVICDFDTTQNMSCWIGDSAHFYYGDAATVSSTAGVTSSDGLVKMFAGPRKDHFFFNLDGFNAVRTTVMGLATAPTKDANGCFAMSANNAGGLTAAQTALVVGQLKNQPNMTNNMPQDFFATLNTLAIVLQVDKSLLTKGGSFFSVWGATHKKM
jgi:hypothetical protein